MTDNNGSIATSDPLRTKRPWNRHSFYMSDQMAVMASRIAKSEERRTGRQTGAGQVIDRAMRRYVSELMTSDELAQVLDAQSNE